MDERLTIESHELGRIPLKPAALCFLIAGKQLNYEPRKNQRRTMRIQSMCEKVFDCTFRGQKKNLNVKHVFQRDGFFGKH